MPTWGEIIVVVILGGAAAVALGTLALSYAAEKWRTRGGHTATSYYYENGEDLWEK